MTKALKAATAQTKLIYRLEALAGACQSISDGTAKPRTELTPQALAMAIAGNIRQALNDQTPVMLTTKFYKAEG